MMLANQCRKNFKVTGRDNGLFKAPIKRLSSFLVALVAAEWLMVPPTARVERRAFETTRLAPHTLSVPTIRGYSTNFTPGRVSE